MNLCTEPDRQKGGSGDKVKISIRITDETEIKHVFMFYVIEIWGLLLFLSH